MLTIATYHFKDKNIFFEDSIILPNEAFSLSDYRVIAEVLQWLYKNVYEKSSNNYKPQAYSY
ncbi:MAG: hypothetical protein DRJ38_07655 [Thermoprotei archaeon]|nr:MAG: hypothetical protein DRJ38_07655 [Thermoprotei archaeon]